MKGDQLLEKVLHDVSEAVCKDVTSWHGACMMLQRGQPDDAVEPETVAWTMSCLRPLVTSSPRPAHTVRVLGKGTQGVVSQVVYDEAGKDGTPAVARKVCVLTPAQVEAGGALVGLQDLAHGAASCMGLLPASLQQAVVVYHALHLQPVCDVTQWGAQVEAGSSSEGLLVTWDMECCSCNLTHYTDEVLHTVPGLKEVLQGHSVASWHGTPLGTRAVPVLPLITIAQQSLLAVKAMHKARLIHGDLKPDNLLLHVEPGTGRVLAVKAGDLGATCIMQQDGSTDQARLATILYQHPEKKELRYSDQHQHHSAARFDVTELCASLLQTTLGLCPNTQLRTVLVNHTLMDLALGHTTIEQASQCAAGDATAAVGLRLWQSLQHVSQHQELGGVFVGLVRVLMRGWHSAGRVGIDDLLSELSVVQSCAGDALSPSGRVVLDGAQFPFGTATLDKVFSKLSPQQVVALTCVHPDAWQLYSAYQMRQCVEGLRARQQALAQRRVQQRAARAAEAAAPATPAAAAKAAAAAAAAAAALRAAEARVMQQVQPPVSTVQPMVPVRAHSGKVFTGPLLATARLSQQGTTSEQPSDVASPARMRPGKLKLPGVFGKSGDAVLSPTPGKVSLRPVSPTPARSKEKAVSSTPVRDVDAAVSFTPAVAAGSPTPARSQETAVSLTPAEAAVSPMPAQPALSPTPARTAASPTPAENTEPALSSPPGKMADSCDARDDPSISTLQQTPLIQIKRDVCDDANSPQQQTPVFQVKLRKTAALTPSPPKKVDSLIKQAVSPHKMVDPSTIQAGSAQLLGQSCSSDTPAPNMCPPRHVPALAVSAPVKAPSPPANQPAARATIAAAADMKQFTVPATIPAATAASAAQAQTQAPSQAQAALELKESTLHLHGKHSEDGSEGSSCIAAGGKSDPGLCEWAVGSHSPGCADTSPWVEDSMPSWGVCLESAFTKSLSAVDPSPHSDRYRMSSDKVHLQSLAGLGAEELSPPSPHLAGSDDVKPEARALDVLYSAEQSVSDDAVVCVKAHSEMQLGEKVPSADMQVGPSLSQSRTSSAKLDMVPDNPSMSASKGHVRRSMSRPHKREGWALLGAVAALCAVAVSVIVNPGRPRPRTVSRQSSRRSHMAAAQQPRLWDLAG